MIFATTTTERRNRAPSILASAVAHAVVLVSVVALAPVVVEHTAHLDRTPLVFSPLRPPVSTLEPAPPRQIRKPLILPESALRPSVLPPPIDVVSPPRDIKWMAKTQPPIPEIEVPVPAPPAPAPPPKPAVKTGLFAAAPNPAPAPAVTAGGPLQTGGFEEREAVAAPAASHSAARIGGFNTAEPGHLARIAYRTPPPSTGGFAAPEQQSTRSGGPGRGAVVSGSAFSSPVHTGASLPALSSGATSEAGFGGPSIADRRPNSRSAPVSRSRFGDIVARPAAPGEVRQTTAAARQTPIKILGKPKPVYTDEGRRLKIEGEVILEALFRAGGEVRVLRVVEGLGSGLDESARQAAEAIRFAPATCDGLPVDATAVIRIQFQLAY